MLDEQRGGSRTSCNIPELQVCEKKYNFLTCMSEMQRACWHCIPGDPEITWVIQRLIQSLENETFRIHKLSSLGKAAKDCFALDASDCIVCWPQPQHLPGLAGQILVGWILRPCHKGCPGPSLHPKLQIYDRGNHSLRAAERRIRIPASWNKSPVQSVVISQTSNRGLYSLGPVHQDRGI